MIPMKWKKDYSVNIPEIDVHHKHLFSLLNRLNDAMSNGDGNEILGETLDELAEYTKFHFRAEEKLMLEIRFPGLATHAREHDYMLSRVTQFKTDFSEGKAVVSVRVLTFLRNWLQKHILVSDKEYSVFTG